MNVISNPEIFKKTLKEGITELFKDKIKISFLIKVYEEVKKSDVYQQYQLANARKSANPAYVVTGTESCLYETLKMITAIHITNITFMDDDGKGKQQKNKEYIETLKQQTLLEIQLRDFVPYVYANDAYFHYYPYVFFNYVAAEYIKKTILNQYKDLKMIGFVKEEEERTVKNMFIDISISVESIIAICEIPGISQAMSILRTLIDSIFTLSILIEHKNIICEYNKFIEYAAIYDENNKMNLEHKYSEEFDELYNSLFKGKKRPTKKNFLNYGWLRKISGNELKTYSASDFRKSAPISENVKKHLESCYPFLCKFIHGDFDLNKYVREDTYLFIQQIIAIILAQDFVYFENIINNKGIIGDFDIQSNIKENFKYIVEYREMAKIKNHREYK